jgi:hypothetical protein
MDIGGVNRLKVPVAPQSALDVKRNVNTNSDRDAQGQGGYQKPSKPLQLTPEQEQEALAALNSMPAFQRTGLRAELVQGEGVVTHILVRDAQGQMVRHMPYEQIVDLYLNRHMDNEKGTLLRRAA